MIKHEKICKLCISTRIIDTPTIYIAINQATFAASLWVRLIHE